MFFWRDLFYRELRAFPAMSAYIRVSAYMSVMRRATDSALLRKPQCRARGGSPQGPCGTATATGLRRVLDSPGHSSRIWQQSGKTGDAT